MNVGKTGNYIFYAFALASVIVFQGMLLIHRRGLNGGIRVRVTVKE